jgi:F0F1-type ATP synthase epsilon subunit
MADITPKDTIHVVVVSPNEVMFEDDVKKITIPTPIQTIAILPEHTPLYAEIAKGEIEITTKKDKIETLAVEGGVVRVKMNRVSVIIGF